MRRDYTKVEIRDPDEIEHKVGGVDHNLRFETSTGPGSSSGTVVGLTDNDLDALVAAIAARPGSKLAMIARVVALQADNQEADDGDKYLSDANLAMEAIEEILAGGPDMSLGSMRTFFPEGVRS